MKDKKQLSIKEFSRLTAIKRENLRFYDRIGLLSPEARGENNYRYYSRRQLSTAYLISILRWVGVGIEEIKEYSAHRTPEKSLELFAQQDARIQAEMERLTETRLILKMYSDMAKASLDHGDNGLLLETKSREPIFLCPPIPPGMNSEEGEFFSYEQAEAKGINLGFPEGVLVSAKDIQPQNSAAVGRYYFKVGKAGNGSNAYKPSGLYAVAYGRGNPWNSAQLYGRLLTFIQEQGMRICGDAYEEYPLSDISVQDLNSYGIRIEIPVEAAEMPEA